MKGKLNKPRPFTKKQMSFCKSPKKSNKIHILPSEVRGNACVPMILEKKQFCSK